MYTEESRISEVPVYSPIPYAASAATGQVSRAANENLKGLCYEILKKISFMNSSLHVIAFGILTFLNFPRARTETLTLSYSTDVSGLFSGVPAVSVFCKIREIFSIFMSCQFLY
jgi:hypothetical protein